MWVQGCVECGGGSLDAIALLQKVHDGEWL